MILLVLGAVAKPPMEYKIPFPTSPVFEGQQSICLEIDVPLGVPNVEVEEGPFIASCQSVGGHTRLCMTFQESAVWPERFPGLECPGADGTIKMVPVIGFDPEDSIDDGIEILRNVAKIQAMFRVPEIEQAYGILAGGSCGIEDHLLTVIVGNTEDRKQTCMLILGEEERAVEVRLVGKMSRTD